MKADRSFMQQASGSFPWVAALRVINRAQIHHNDILHLGDCTSEDSKELGYTVFLSGKQSALCRNEFPQWQVKTDFTM